MGLIAANLQAVHDRIGRAARAAGRDPSEVVLVAVSKTFPAASIREAAAAGQRDFGENFVQEAVDKITELGAAGHPDGPPGSDAGATSLKEPRLLPLEWHFIGPIQSNKTRLIAAHFRWVHGIDREKTAQRLNAALPAHLPPLNVCLQVNVSGEATKSGIAPGEEERLAAAVARLPRLRLRGLMAIPEPTADTDLQRRRFALLRKLKDSLVARGYALDVLSMGMSNDFEAAIAEGSTMVRVGTAIFGNRDRVTRDQ